MKRFTINIFIFFIIVVVIDFSVGRVGDYLVKNVNGGDAKRTNDLVMKDQHDVLILGSSRARHHYDTPFLSDTLGIDVYNAGYDGNGVVLAYGLLGMVLERYKPRLILYDVEPAFDIHVYTEDNNHKRYISRLKPYYRHPVAGEIISDVSSEEWYKVHSGMMRYNMSLISLVSEGLRGKNDYSKGFSPLYGSYELEPSNDSKVYKIDSFKVSYMEKLINLAKTSQIPIIVVASPKYGQKDLPYIHIVRNLCKTKGVPFLDYYDNEEFESHKEWFKEPMHLNSYGAKVFSKYIAEDINTIFLGI